MILASCQWLHMGVVSPHIIGYWITQLSLCDRKPSWFSHYNGPVMPKAFPCHGFLMIAWQLLFSWRLDMAQYVYELIIYPYSISGPLSTKLSDVLPQNLVKSRRREIQVWTFPIALKIDMHLCSCIAELPVLFQSHEIIIASDLSWLRDFTRLGGKTSVCLVKRGSGFVPRRMAV